MDFSARPGTSSRLETRSSRLLAGLLFFAASATLLANTYTVLNTNESGAGSLRQAILDANANAGLDTIAFGVTGTGCDGSGVCTISPASDLPTITSPVLIDGYTQTGSSPNTNAQGALNTAIKIAIIANGGNGFQFSTNSDGSTLRGVAVSGGELVPDKPDYVKRAEARAAAAKPKNARQTHEPTEVTAGL